jgi:hypothetical protein
MPLQTPKGPNYVKINTIYVNSEDRETGSVGPYDYVIRLTNEIQYVIGMELTSYNLPSSLAPTFVAAGSGFDGTNKLDFALSNGVITTVFSTEWPEKNYTYQNLNAPYLSYLDTLASLLDKAIDSDPDFGNGGANETFFDVDPDPEERTVVVARGTGVTGLQFLFGTGPNAKDSAQLAMGFANADTPIALTTTSPSPTNLNPFSFVDVSIVQIPEYTPLSRVYMTNNLAFGTTRNEQRVTRSRLLSSQPIHRLKEIRIKLTLANGVVPPSTTGLAHDLVFTVFSLANEDSVPSWVNQTFVI